MFPMPFLRECTRGLVNCLYVAKLHFYSKWSSKSIDYPSFCFHRWSLIANACPPAVTALAALEGIAVLNPTRGTGKLASTAVHTLLAEWAIAQSLIASAASHFARIFSIVDSGSPQSLSRIGMIGNFSSAIGVCVGVAVGIRPSCCGSFQGRKIRIYHANQASRL